MKTILELQHVTKHFKGLVAVNDVSITVKERQIHALIGPNGAGKTTTVNMINGTLPTTEGTIEFLGKRIDGAPTYKIAQMGMGRTFQNIKMFGTLSVLENMMVGAHHIGMKSGIIRTLLDFKGAKAEEEMLREKAMDTLKFIGIYDLKDELVSNLAYGRQKIAEFGRALMIEPKLILLDEPAAGLNPSERKEFVDVLKRAYEEKLIDFFLIEHNMDVVMNLSHMITVLNFGSKIAEGTPGEIQANPTVIKAYLGERYKAVGSRN